jgi:DNA-binding transcriptional LysR family regulator
MVETRVHSLLYGASLKVFVPLCRHRSFTLAAKTLGLSQAFVSQSIQKLELALGVSLFDRQVRPIA